MFKHYHHTSSTISDIYQLSFQPLRFAIIIIT